MPDRCTQANRQPKMKKTIILLVICISSTLSKGQELLNTDSINNVFKETLQKSRNAVSNATNSWRYDNSKEDYFKRDTIVLNTARSYKTEYCNGVNWSFYTERNFILEFIHYCNEPPTKDISRKKDYMKMRIKKMGEKIYLQLINRDGLFDSFEILDLRKNKPLEGYEIEFDYTIVLVRKK